MKSLSHLCYRGLGKEIKDFFLRELSRKRWILLVNKEHTSPLQRNHHILSYLLTRFGGGHRNKSKLITEQPQICPLTAFGSARPLAMLVARPTRTS